MVESMEKTLTLVIPCLNEEEAAPSVLRAVDDVRKYFLNELHFQQVQVIVVDDASRDKSVPIVSSFSFVDLHCHPTTRGYGASLRSGFERATGNWICFFDMDSSYPVHEIPHMWKTLVATESDLVLGRRLFASEGMSLTRGFGNWVFTTLTRFFFQTAIHDVCSGFRIFSRQCLPEILSISETTLGYSLEMSIRMDSSRWKIREHKINYQPRKGSSKLSVWKDGWQFLTLILSAAVRTRLKKTVRM